MADSERKILPNELMALPHFNLKNNTAVLVKHLLSKNNYIA